MAKQEWKPGNMIYPLPAVMVSCRNNAGEENIITVAWTGTICTNPPMAYISVRPERHSYDMIKESGVFVINLTTKDLVWATDYCGVTSGKNVDKFEQCHLHKEEATEINAPMIAESPVNIECKVREIKELGSHHMFIADVVNVHADEKYMDEKGKFSLAKAEPLAYSHGEYYDLNHKLGKFGYSIQKKKNNKKVNKKRK